MECGLSQGNTPVYSAFCNINTALALDYVYYVLRWRPETIMCLSYPVIGLTKKRRTFGARKKKVLASNYVYIGQTVSLWIETLVTSIFG